MIVAMPKPLGNPKKNRGVMVKIETFLKRPSPFLQKLLGRKIEPDAVDESNLPEGILTVLADQPQQALAAALRCRPMVYEQIGVIMGISRHRVRQLEDGAAVALRRVNRFRQLCRFMPGWQNALRLPPEDANSLLPGETVPLAFGQMAPWPFNAQTRLAFELTLARWERLGQDRSYRPNENSLQRKPRLERQSRFEAIFSGKYDKLEWKKNRGFDGNFRLCEIFLNIDGKPPCQGCPIKVITGASHCARTPLAGALRESRLGLNDPQFQTAAGKMASYMRNLWTKTNGLKKKIKPSKSSKIVSCVGQGFCGWVSLV
ncbi:MAG TPA: sigma factor-like helix-turn-helix DNA-binding protein [Candidatus Cybelea sp.]|nr:sigma factor-like helix-turn-helix DNA-binding protein [Candidatus Cybelea sp.]